MRRAEIDEWHLAAQAPEAPDDYAETLAEKLRQNELLAAQDPREPWSPRSPEPTITRAPGRNTLLPPNWHLEVIRRHLQELDA